MMMQRACRRQFGREARASNRASTARAAAWARHGGEQRDRAFMCSGVEGLCRCPIESRGHRCRPRRRCWSGCCPCCWDCHATHSASAFPLRCRTSDGCPSPIPHPCSSLGRGGGKRRCIPFMAATLLLKLLFETGPREKSLAALTTTARFKHRVGKEQRSVQKNVDAREA